MGETKIEWATHVWNPVRGCSRVSEGCRNCYAERMAARFSGNGFDGMTAESVKFQPFAGFAEMAKSGPRWTGKVELIESMLDLPLHWRKPRRIFVASMSDIFHDALTDAERDRLFAVMALASWHDYLDLTKRPENQLRYISDPNTPFRVLKAMDVIAVDFEMKGLKEEWRPVVEDKNYEVSNYGSVRRNGVVLAQAPHGNGYRQVAISTDGSPVSRLVHVLVLEAFVGSRPDSTIESAHRNGDRADNRLANLRWETKEGNMADAARHGTAGVWMKGRATLSAEQVREIRRRRALGEKLDDIAAAVGSNRKQVCAVALGKIFKSAPLAWPLPNVWLGVSVEDRKNKDRIDVLRQTPAALRFLSLEPLLGNLGELDLTGIGLCVVGGESGPGARPMRTEWARALRDQCHDAGVPFFFKQWGAWAPHPFNAEPGDQFQPPDHPMIRVGKRAAGRLLDGREWNEFPAETAVRR
jgi:protein gp37